MTERRSVEKGTNFRGRIIWADVLPSGQDNITRHLRQVDAGFNQFIVYSKALCYVDDQNLDRAVAHYNLLSMISKTSAEEMTSMFGSYSFSVAPIKLHRADDSVVPYLIFGKAIGQDGAEYSRLLDYLISKANEVIYPLSGGYGLIPGQITQGNTGSEPAINEVK